MKSAIMGLMTVLLAAGLMAACSGKDGANGPNGTSGATTLVSVDSEPSGTNCAYGGSKVSVGIDENADQVLEPEEITSVDYICNGDTGPGITWVHVTDTSVQGVSNIGYLADNISQVTITLPASPALGDVLQVSGMGTGGWKIAQNAVQTIWTENLPNGYGDMGRIWTPRPLGGNLESIACSSDGTKLITVPNYGQIFTSIDSGATWTAHGPLGNWFTVGSNADGTKLFAGEYGGGYLYTSTDSGVTWTQRIIGLNWYSIASSASGSKVVAADFGGRLYTSIDAGANWTPRASTGNWWSVASSSDGVKLAAVQFGGQIYTSIDSGANWTARDAARNWLGAASSSDGTKLAAVTLGGRIYTSIDSGATWTVRGPSGNWHAIASSADGTRLVAGQYQGGRLYTSADSGITWTARTGTGEWTSIASSSDGMRLATINFNNQIYTSSPSPQTIPGVSGALIGSQYDAVALQYLGNDLFMIMNYAGDLVVQ